MLDFSALRQRLWKQPQGARLVAVSKGQSVASIRNLYAQGQRDFGENYLDELEHKAPQLIDLTDLRWVFIGQLQSNKIQRILRYAAEIQTVTTEKHLRYIAKYAPMHQRLPFPVFLEVNCGEAQKGGVSIAEAERLAAIVAAKPAELAGIDLRGLMAIPPESITDLSCNGSVPPLYSELVAAARRIGKGEISLGMSADFETALRSGSNCIRIGRALFGDRPLDN